MGVTLEGLDSSQGKGKPLILNELRKRKERERYVNGPLCNMGGTIRPDIEGMLQRMPSIQVAKMRGTPKVYFVLMKFG